MDYKNPYLGLPKDAKLRTTFECSWEDVQILRSYEPKEGVIQTTLSILLKTLINELKRNLEPGDRYAYQYAVANATINLGKRVAAPEPAARKKPTRTGKAVGGNDPS